VLWAWREIETFIGIRVFTVTGIVGVDIISDWMGDIDIDAARRIYYLDETTQTNPGLLVDRSAEVLRDGQAAQSNAAMVLGVTLL